MEDSYLRLWDIFPVNREREKKIRRNFRRRRKRNQEGNSNNVSLVVWNSEYNCALCWSQTKVLYGLLMIHMPTCTCEVGFRGESFFFFFFTPSSRSSSSLPVSAREVCTCVYMCVLSGAANAQLIGKWKKGLTDLTAFAKLRKNKKTNFTFDNTHTQQ